MQINHISTMGWSATRSQTFWKVKKRTLGCTAVNKASGCDRILWDIFKTLKDNAFKALHSIFQQTWKTQQWSKDWKKSSSEFPRRLVLNNVLVIRQLHSSPKPLRSCLKILHARLQHYVNQELPDVWAEFRKGRGTRDKIANIRWIIEKAKEFQKNIYLCFIDYTKAFDYEGHDKLWRALSETGKPDHLTCLLRNLYAGQEATVRTLYGTTDWFRIEKGVQPDCLLSPCLFNLYAEHIMRNAKLESR